jgi:hypothetical protein
MTDAASALRAASECLFAPVGRWEIDEGIKWVEAAVATLPPGIDPALVHMVETLDWRKLEMVADELERQAAVSQERTSLHNEVSKPAKPRRPRKSSIAKQIKQAEKSGKSVTSITTPDGTTLHFSSESTEASNPWLDDLKVTKQ